jgi:UDP-glucose 4-epimerase
MKVVVTGATGNVGTSTVKALSESTEIEEIVGLARREPTLAAPKTRWVEANVLTSNLVEIFEGATRSSTSPGRSSPPATQ